MKAQEGSGTPNSSPAVDKSETAASTTKPCEPCVQIKGRLSLSFAKSNLKCHENCHHFAIDTAQHSALHSGDEPWGSGVRYFRWNAFSQGLDQTHTQTCKTMRARTSTLSMQRLWRTWHLRTQELRRIQCVWTRTQQSVLVELGI